MKISHIKKDKKIDKVRYLSHKKQESFLFQTMPSFLQAFKAYKRQEESIVLDNWIALDTEIISPESDLLTITWLGHASFLIRYGDITIITDPVFGSLPLFSRLTQHGIKLDMLPMVDVVLLSHNHKDHMDFSSLTHLAYRYHKTYIAVPNGDAYWFSRSLFPYVHEYEWYDEFVIESVTSKTIHCVFLPAYHWSRRGLFDTNQSLWGSWLIQCGQHSIYFGGDTAYFDHFLEIGTQYQLDIALLPIAPIEPYEWMSRSHMSPKDAGRAFFDLNAKVFIPMHWGTFQFGIDNYDDPVRLLQQWELDHSAKLVAQNKKLKIMKIGKTLSISK